MSVDDYIVRLGRCSETPEHELITECLDYFGVNGVIELTEESESRANMTGSIPVTGSAIIRMQRVKRAKLVRPISIMARTQRIRNRIESGLFPRWSWISASSRRGIGDTDTI